MMVLFCLMPAYTMYDVLANYKKIKNILEEKGVITEGDLRNLVKEENSDKEDIQKKFIELKDLLENIITYENCIYVFEGSKKRYYISDEKMHLLVSYIDEVVKKGNWIFLEELVTGSIIFLNMTDLKIFINDMMPNLFLAHKENKEIIAYDNRESESGLCDCCKSYSEHLIETKDGRFCSEQCQKFMEEFYKSVVPKQDRVMKTVNIGAVIGVNSKIKKLLKEQAYYANKSMQTRHGQAAEVLNTKFDRLKGYNAEVLGQNNAKNGPDRIRNGQLIQTKYCKTAKETLRAALDESGNYRYGEDIILEVPKDQYLEVVDEARKKGLNIKITPGSISYRASVNIARCGTIESILWDTSQSVIYSGIPAFGLSAVVGLSYQVLNGEEIENAFENSIRLGLKSAATTTFIGVTSAQINKMEFVKEFGKSEFMKNLPIKMETSNVISTLAFSTKDIIEFFSGYISGKQLVTNVASSSAGVIAGTALGGMFGGASCIIQI